MSSSSSEEIVEVFNAVDDDVDRLCELSFDVFTTARFGAVTAGWARINRVVFLANPLTLRPV
jgi:hypothetical protein